MEKNKTHVFFSNQLECLASCLQKQLFAFGSAFERRLVIVPDKGMKTYLYHHFAMHTKAKSAFGMEVMTLSEGLQELIRDQKKVSPFYFPSALDLSIYLEQEITSLHIQRTEDPHLAPLWKYLGEGGEQINGSLRRKIISLSEQIARFFSMLGLQDDIVISEWLSHEGWQQDLWKSIFSAESIWSYPQKILQEMKPSLPNLHLFGFSFLPKVYFDFFTKGSAYTYLLSPSEYFWEDFYSDKERVFLQKVLEGKKVRLKVREQFDLYLRESLPLLGNWGKMGKEFLGRLGQTEPYIEEHYVPCSTNTLLGAVQDDFLHLGQREEEALLPAQDVSLQLHACTSKMREVEVLHEMVLQLLQKSKEERHPLTLSDISILSTSLGEYVPYIHQVFGLSSIDYRIIDGVETTKDDHISALEHLLYLSEKRFSLTSILELFSFSPFQKKQGWKQEDVYLLSKWFEKVGIEWGYNTEHRTRVLAKSLSYVEEVRFPGTWQHGFERLLSGLILAIPEESNIDDLSFAWPQYSLEWNESELLGQAISVISSLFQDFEKIDSLSSSFEEWVILLNRLSTKYLIDDEEMSFSSECQRLKKLLGTSGSTPFSLESFKRVFRSLSAKRKSSFQGSHLEAVSFSPFKQGLVLPSKVIYLLGMEEESFPRKEPSLPFCDLSALKNKTYMPSKAEEDRYLFLEALLSARKHFMVSYCRVSAQDQKPQTAAAVVEELFSYVKNTYKAGVDPEVLMISHPALSFSESYFEKKSPVSSISPTTQRAARSYYSLYKKTLAPFFPEFYGDVVGDRNLSDTEIVSIKELTRFAKHPIKFFMQDILGIYLPSLFQKEEGEFILPAYEKSAMRAEVLKKPFEKVLKTSASKGLLPTGLFHDVARKKVKEETGFLDEQLKQWGVAKEKIFSVTLSDSCREPSVVENRWFLPSLTIKSPLGTVFKIEGTISDVSTKGLLFHGENKIRDLVQVWPLYLVFLQIQSQIGCASKSLYLTKKPEELFFDIENPEAFLGGYLDCFNLCKAKASLLMPAWSEWILENDEMEFEKKMQARSFIETSPFPDDYLRWLFLRDPSPSLEGLHAQQKQIQRKIFEPMFTREKR